MKLTLISIFLAIALIGGTILFSRSGTETGATAQNQNNISIADGKQVIEISARGGYSPRNTTAKADMPTIIKVKTNGTFDCSSALSIPSLKYQNYLPSTGETLIEVPPQKQGTVLQGFCAMGMYNFSIKFN